MVEEVRPTERLSALLAGSEGKAARKAAEILMALARIFGAGTFVPVSSAQISGVSYQNLSDAGLDFLESFAAEGGRVVVPAMLNPAGMDLDRWREMGIDESFAVKQKRVVAAYARMGVTLTCTCTPYLAGHAPGKGEILAWGESSAVTYVNSVIGARSNREGGPAALAAALVGEVPVYGLHLDENRRPDVTVNVASTLASPAEYGALGAWLGERPGSIPFIRSGFRPTPEGLKALSAALPTYSGASLFYWEGATPEWERWKRPGLEIRAGREELAGAFRRCSNHEGKPDLVFTGCPHLSLEEVEWIAGRLKHRKVSLPLWIFLSRKVEEEARARGLCATILEAGGKMYCGTCPVVSPVMKRFTSVLTDSAKGCYYLQGVHGMGVRLGTTQECMDRAVGDS